MEDAYIVKGGQPLKGEVQLSGAKNIALKVIIAALMFDGPVTIKNIPHIRDIEELIHLITILGGKASFVEKNKVIIDGSNITSNRIDLLHASKVRVSFMFFAPLLKKFRQVLIPNPGGCRIGARDIDRPISVLRHMGVDVSYNSEDGYYTAKLKSETLNGTTYRFDKPSHTGTEFAIMLASLAEGITVLENPSSEPEIDDLIEFLNNSGAKITKKNSSIIIEGVNTLKSDTTYTIQNDRNEAVTYACLGIATRGDVTIKGIQVKDIEIFIDKVKESGGNVEIGDNCIRFFYMKPINATEITVLPHPGFMTDWQGPWAVLMTQAEGTSIIHETVYENRFAYVKELRKVGAKIKFFKPQVDDPEKTYQFNWTEEHTSPQGVKIYGKKTLHNGVMTVADLRAGATLIIAAAVAKGESIINGASIIERGYENIVEKITRLGGNIKKV